MCFEALNIPIQSCLKQDILDEISSCARSVTGTFWHFRVKLNDEFWASLGTTLPVTYSVVYLWSAICTQDVTLFLANKPDEATTLQCNNARKKKSDIHSLWIPVYWIPIWPSGWFSGLPRQANPKRTGEQRSSCYLVQEWSRVPCAQGQRTFKICDFR